MYASLGRLITLHPRGVIIGVLVAAVLVLAGARNTHFVSDFDSSLPNRSPLSAQIHANQDRFGGRNTLAFLVSGGDAKARLASACALSSGLQKLSGIAPGRVYGVGTNSLKFVETEGADLSVTGLAQVCSSPGGLTSEILEGLGPQKALVMAPNGDLIVAADLNVISGQFEPLLEGVERLIKRSRVVGVTIDYSGQPAFLAQNDKYSRRIALFFPVIMGLILLLHWEALRSVQAVVVPIFTGLFATLLGLGIYGWMGQPLDTYTVLAPVLILAVGAGHSVQLLKRYMEEVRLRTAVGDQVSADQNAAAIVATLKAMGPVLTIAVLGASACLFALLLLDVTSLARFGLLAGVGIVCALVLELTMVPAIRVLLKRPVMKPGYGELSKFWQTGLLRIGNLALSGPVLAISIGLALVVVALGVGVSKVKASHSMAVYTAPDVPVQRAVTKLVDAGVGPYVFDVVVDSGRPDGAFDPEIQQSLMAIQTNLERDRDVSSVLSPTAIISFLKCRFAGQSPCTSQLPQSADEAKQIWTVLFGGGREAGMIDDTGQYVRLRAFVRTDETIASQRLIDRVNASAKEQGVSISLGGSAVTAKALADGIVRVSLEKAALLVCIVMVIGGLAFRSISLALLFAIPSLLTIAANFAYLGWTGTTLNVATAAVATIAVGVGLDYLVYLTFRIREAQRQGLSYLDAIRVGHASAGGAALCVAMAVAVGYAVLIFSPGYLVHHWIAALVPMTMLMSLFGSLFAFPFLLRLFQPALNSWTKTPNPESEDWKLFSDWSRAPSKPSDQT